MPEEAGVSEYWIIDADEKKALFLVRDAGSGFVEARLDETLFRSRILPGLVLDVRWFWQRPLPETPPIVQALLAVTKQEGKST